MGKGTHKGEREQSSGRPGGRPRSRYVLFESSSRDALHAVYAELRNHFDEWRAKPPAIIETRGSVTIIKCGHVDQARLCAVLNSVPGVKTLRASGTIRKLREKMPK